MSQQMKLASFIQRSFSLLSFGMSLFLAVMFFAMAAPLMFGDIPIWAFVPVELIAGGGAYLFFRLGRKSWISAGRDWRRD